MLNKTMFYALLLQLAACVLARYPPDYVDFNGGDTESQGRVMQALMGFMKPPVEIDVSGGSGPFKAASYEDPSLPRHVIYAPKAFTTSAKMMKRQQEQQQQQQQQQQLLPLVVFGNGGCLGLGQTHGTLLTEIASHGYIVIANGVAGNNEVVFSKNTDMFDAINWAAQQANSTSSDTRTKLPVDMTKIATAGQSCGGMQAYTTAQDERVRTTMILNSGLLGRASPLRSQLVQKLRGPVVYFLGGWTDVAYSNGYADYDALTKTPAVLLNSNLGHGGGLSDKNGGITGAAAVQWLDWQLKGNVSAKEQFLSTKPMAGYNEQKFKNWS